MTSSEITETPDTVGAYPRLTPAQISWLAASGECMRVSRGQVLARAGEDPHWFFAVVSGCILVTDDTQPERTEVHGEGRFTGDIGLLEGQPSFVNVIALTDGEVIRLPAATLGRLVGRHGTLGETILRAYLIRRSLAIGVGSGLRIIGSRFDPDTRKLVEFVTRNRIPHRFLDLDEDDVAERTVERLGLTPDEVPIVIVAGRRVLHAPTIRELARVLGLHSTTSEPEYDVAIIGAGPAGLAASIYASSDGLKTVLCDAWATGGQAGRTSRIENYLGFPSGIGGAELADLATVQAQKFGTTILVPALANSMSWDDPGFIEIGFEDGSPVRSRSVVLAPGVRYDRLAALAPYETSSVFYAATPVEAHICGNEEVAVVGGGNSAGQAALFLARTSTNVHLVIRHEDLSESMSRYLIAQVEDNPRITIHRNSEIVDATGDRALRTVEIADRVSGEARTVPVRFVFVFIGARPATAWLPPDVLLDSQGYILTGADLPVSDDRRALRPPPPLETSRPDVFAIGDVRSGSAKRMSAAIGEGASVVPMLFTAIAQQAAR